MKTTTSGYKTLIASKNARSYLLKIDLTLANNTVLHLTGEDIWEDSFSIDTASSGTDSFDIGSAIIGKCAFTLNNIDGDFDNYDFFNATATIWLGLEGDTVSSTQQYYRMGFFTVDEPSKANGLISLTLLDNMWKFDRPLPTLSLPNSALNIVNSLCSHCGVILATQSFHGSSFSVPEFDTKDMNCRELLQYIAMIGCNFCTITDEGKLAIKWYNTSATSSTTATFDLNQNTTFGTEDIEITGVKIVIDDTAHSVGSSGYVLEIENPLINEDNVNTALNLIWDVLDGFTLRTFSITTASDLSVEIGDKCKIKDYSGNYTYSWITTNSFKLAGQNVQCSAQPPQRTLVTRYSKEVKTAVEEARKQTAETLSTYDQVVQLMNELAVNAMGGFEDYEDVTTGGRIWYWSNMPITKSAQGVCSFEPGSVVFKKTGTGLFVSTNGGSTYGNAYDAQTGELVINMLYAIGIHADWIRTGTLLVGGSHTNPANADIQVYDDSDNLICTINKDGITMHQGIISSPDYAEVSGATYSTTGMKLDVLNDELKSPYFAIDPFGAYFKGTILITGDLDIGTNSCKLDPEEYGIAASFVLKLQAPEDFSGIITYDISYTDGTNTTHVADGTITDDTPVTEGLSLLSAGQWYVITIGSGSSIKVSIENAILAYVGEDGFKGKLQGIVDGKVTSDYGKINGIYYGADEDGTPLYGKLKYHSSGTTLTTDLGNGTVRKDVSGGFSQVTMNDNGLSLVGSGDNSNTIVSIYEDASNRIEVRVPTSGYPDIAHMDFVTSQGSYIEKKVLWDRDIQTSTTDSPPVSLADGHLFLVYE